MRVLVLFLAIVLLPLRGWLGDAMALAPVQPATASHAMHASVVAADAHAEHDMHDPHAMHAGLADRAGHAPTRPAAMHGDATASHGNLDAHDVPDAQDHHDGHGTCDTCQFCHSIVAADWPEVARPVTPPRHLPVAAPVDFASAEAAPGFKPPIS